MRVTRGSGWLHNNTKWVLELDAKGAGNKVFARGDEQELGLFYGLVYNYEWEEESGEPEHRVYYYGSQLPAR